MRTALLFVLLSVTASVLAEKPAPSRSPSERDYAVMTAAPFKAEVTLGERRLDKFLRRLDARRRALLDQTPYVAIQVRALTAGDVPWLTNRLFRGSVRASDFSNDLDNARSIPVEYLLLFDSRTHKMVNEDGVLIVDTPPRYSIALFGSFHAIYAGTVPGW
ncbi:MAG TPA: hypothetical protein VE242_12935 [Chthoniobacterales bacterium]|nr:hypothetical protein [Chthoniobacterales bacterium]